MMTFAETLAYYRSERGLSQAKLARLTGCDHSFISRLESQSRAPRRETVERIASKLGLSNVDTGVLLRSAGFTATDEAGYSHDPLLIRLDRALQEATSGTATSVRHTLSLLIEGMTKKSAVNAVVNALAADVERAAPNRDALRQQFLADIDDIRKETTNA